MMKMKNLKRANANRELEVLISLQERKFITEKDIENSGVSSLIREYKYVMEESEYDAFMDETSDNLNCDLRCCGLVELDNLGDSLERLENDKSRHKVNTRGFYFYHPVLDREFKFNIKNATSPSTKKSLKNAAVKFVENLLREARGERKGFTIATTTNQSPSIVAKTLRAVGFTHTKPWKNPNSGNTVTLWTKVL